MHRPYLKGRESERPEWRPWASGQDCRHSIRDSWAKVNKQWPPGDLQFCIVFHLRIYSSYTREWFNILNDKKPTYIINQKRAMVMFIKPDFFIFIYFNLFLFFFRFIFLFDEERYAFMKVHVPFSFFIFGASHLIGQNKRKIIRCVPFFYLFFCLLLLLIIIHRRVYFTCFVTSNLITLISSDK